MIPRAIIGAGYGDEGKGLLTDAFASPGTLVVRHNGGAQAGHTVVTPDGRRHVFSHVGAGSFAGAATFLSRFFVANPVLFVREVAVLRRLGVAPEVLVDPAAALTTPFDMLLNQAVEQARGAGRHGSVGIGFGETIERNLTEAVALTVGDLDRGDAWLRRRLAAIRAGHVPRRLARLGVVPDEKLARLLADPALVAAFLDDAAQFRAAIRFAEAEVLRGRDVLFEGAQGLLLDAARGAFPHVTRSRTGIANVLSLLGEAGLQELSVTYVTRAYVTRHGAGPLAHAQEKPVATGVVDRTNRPHPFQGTLRHAPLDLDVLRDAIAADRADAPARFAVTAGLVVTCLDQMDVTTPVVAAGRGQPVPTALLAGQVAAAVGMPLQAASYGETRDHLRVTRAAACAA